MLVSSSLFSLSVYSPCLLAQDVYSYDMEHAMGHLTNNILTVLQYEHSVSLQRAADLVGAHWRGLVAAFEEAKILLPSFGDDLDLIVAYVDH